MNKRQFLVWSAVVISMCGCASSKISSLPVTATANHSVKAIAMAPSGGILADAVAVELSNRGYEVIDSPSTTKLLVRLNMSEMEVSKPEGMAKLQGQGIDAYLSVRGVAANDGRPINASARLNSTHTWKVIAGATWQNGWGGMAGSIADRTMRKGLSEAASEITDALLKGIQQN
mgnify:CR=1|jgi:hypothetical protein